MTSTMADNLINPQGDRSRFDTPWKTATQRPFGHIPVIAAIILVHALIIYALNYGAMKHANVPAMAFITLISPRPAMQEAKSLPKPANQPKAVPTVEPVAQPSTESPVVAPTVTLINAPMQPEVSTPVPAPALQTPSEPKLIASPVQYLRAPQPSYPTISRRLREQGKTLVRVLINADGSAEKAEIQQSSGSTRLDEAARQAVLNALFKPFAENGQPVAVYAVIPIQFNLNS